MCMQVLISNDYFLGKNSLPKKYLRLFKCWFEFWNIIVPCKIIDLIKIWLYFEIIDMLFWGINYALRLDRFHMVI